MPHDEEVEVLFCECHSPEHQVILTYWPDDEPIEKMLYVQIHLINYDNFFKRLWAGLRYAFGYHCKYGHWDEVLISPEIGEQLSSFLNKFLYGETATIKENTDGIKTHSP